jgi:hypothetical protein
VPEGDFAASGETFGPHNIHENRPGAWQDDTLIYATYWSAGVRVFDTTNPYQPREVGYYVPPTPVPQPGGEPHAAIQINDIFVDASGLIYATDRYNGGLYVLEYTGERPPAAPPLE